MEFNNFTGFILLLVLSGIIIAVGIVVNDSLGTQTKIEISVLNETVDFNNGAGTLAYNPVLSLTKITSNSTYVNNPVTNTVLTYVASTGVITLNQSDHFTYDELQVANETVDFNGTGTVAKKPISGLISFSSNTSSSNTPVADGIITYVASTGVITLNKSNHFTYDELQVANETVDFNVNTGTVTNKPINTILSFSDNTTTELNPVPKGSITYVASTGVITLNVTAWTNPNATYYVKYNYTESKANGDYYVKYNYTESKKSGDYYLTYTYEKNTAATDVLEDTSDSISSVAISWIPVISIVGVMSIIIGLIVSAFMNKR